LLVFTTVAQLRGLAHHLRRGHPGRRGRGSSQQLGIR
jgi:hypothetical protein